MNRGTLYHRGKHLQENELEAPNNACPLCGSTADRQPVHTIQKDPKVTFLRCSRCEVSSASRMPLPAVLDDYYSQYYDTDGEKITFENSNRFARHLERLCSRSLATPFIRILDFGGGDGTICHCLATMLLARGVVETVEITLVDYQEPVATADPRISFRAHRTLDDLDLADRFELIVASAILEHIPAAGKVIRRLCNHAAPGAGFYARTPWVLPIARFLPRIDTTFPAHVHDMGARFWNRLIETFGLPAELVASQPSIIETGLRQYPARALLALGLKLPARAELALFGNKGRTPLWPIVGGWEVALYFKPGL